MEYEVMVIDVVQALHSADTNQVEEAHLVAEAASRRDR